MSNKIQTSTSALSNFVYRGTYETYYGEYLGGVPRDKREECEEEIGKLAVEIIGEALWDILPSDLDDDFELEYVGTYHPRFYNFETDSVLFSFEYSDELKSWMLDYANENDKAFKQHLKDNYTSRDGFISFTANNWDDWKEGFEEGDWRCVSVILQFVLLEEIGYDSTQHYNYTFEEDASTIISERYTPWEYAERFDNGFVGFVKSGYDEENCIEIYNAYLVDESGKIVNHVEMQDKYGEVFHGSAYAAWNDVEYDLTKRYHLCGTHSVPCDVPEIEVD